MDKKLKQRFMGAIENNDCSAVAEILDQGTDKNTAIKDTVRDSIVSNYFYAIHTRPLIEAIEKESFDVAELLIERGANVNCTDHWDNTPLHYAAQYGSCEFVQKLLDQGADLNKQNKSEETPVAWARYLKRHDVVEVFENVIHQRNKKYKQKRKRSRAK